jgi:hypothetical protein
MFRALLIYTAGPEPNEGYRLDDDSKRCAVRQRVAQIAINQVKEDACRKRWAGT